MTIGRTNRAPHRRWRQRLINQAKTNGQTTCPICGRTLNWNSYQQPNSPEADHIIPITRGGLNTLDNGRIICRQCNLQKNNKTIDPGTETTTQLLQW